MNTTDMHRHVVIIYALYSTAGEKQIVAEVYHDDEAAAMRCNTLVGEGISPMVTSRTEPPADVTVLGPRPEPRRGWLWE
jgi:hypothetical protein